VPVPHRILVAEHRDQLRDSICHLRVDGYVCTAVGDSDKALLATADQGCDLIVMDIAIPPLAAARSLARSAGGSRGGKRRS